MGHFEVLEPLGAGGMGEVFKARDQRLNRLVALKFLPETAQGAARDRFEREALAIAALNHPHICTLYEVGSEDGRPYLVLELVEGDSLAQRMAGTPQPVAMAAGLIETLARAIHAAHQQGVVHRDLTPANVLLTAEGIPKITDFGLAKLLIGGGDLRTHTGELLGTPSYMAPEQAASRHHAISASCSPAGHRSRPSRRLRRRARCSPTSHWRRRGCVPSYRATWRRSA